ncbi:MAG: hypothetical protein JWR55_1533 [Aeromicrobium sp.]|nr:hypothetical protein [Aeromicrobium sp.]
MDSMDQVPVSGTAPVVGVDPVRAPLLVATDLVKAYPGTRALDGASFSLAENEIHTLVGSNGAGKSTLVSVICGRTQADSGSLTIGGRPVDFGARNYLAANSIGYVSQEGSLDVESTAYENVFLARERTRRGLISYKTMLRAAQELADEYEFDLDLRRSVRSLSPSERKIVEILRALSLRPKVLVLDEPTAALPKPDIDHLLAIMKGLSKSTSIVFISHYMNEIFGVSDRITVMRDGKDVSVQAVTDTSEDQLVAEMVGPQAMKKHQGLEQATRRSGGADGETVLSTTALATKDGRVVNANLSVAKGEIVGLFGMVGAGKSELLEALYGLRPLGDGELVIGGQPSATGSWSVRRAIARGLALVPEDRLKNALVAAESASWNLAAPHWRRRSGLFARLRSLEGSLAQKASTLVTIRGELISQPLSNLSGGNKQKVSVTRWLVTDESPDVLLLDEPTQGLDVVAREEIYALIRALAEQGTSVVLSSSDLAEALTVCDRLYVMRAGETVPVPDDLRTREHVLLTAINDTTNEEGRHE